MSKQNFDSPFESPTLVRLLTNRAFLQRDEVAFNFLPDVASEDLCITFGELERRARAIGAWLQHEGAAGERVLLLYPSGLDYIAAFFGCMCAGAIAIPVYPPRLNRPMPDLEAICVDAQPAFALTTASVLSNIERRLAHSTGLKALRWMAIEEVPTGLEDDWREPPVNVDGVAFLQYTSGSTGARRGTKVSHRNIMHNLALIRYGFELASGAIGAFWLPMHHDMGLIGAILEPFFIGRPSTLMSPASFLQRPIKWLEAITRFKATITGAPNFAFDFCVNRIAPEDRSALDLSSLKVVFCGAEPIRNETLERFAQAFEQSGFRREMYYPCYGLAEATLLVSGAVGAGAPVVQHVRQSALTENKVVPSSAGESDSRTLIGCGKTFPGQKIIIVHPETLVQLPSDEVGEIWVSGPSVTQGYWNCPEETERIFHAYLADSGEGPFLRTGDLGFLRDGELFVTGRFKDLIIINGRNYYPHDIERTVGYSHPSLRLYACAAFSVEAQGSERLVIVQEVSREHLKNLSVPDVVEAIRQAVTAEYDLSLDALVLIKPGTIPKTSSGKIQRGSCRSAFMNDGLQKIGEWSSVINVESKQLTLASDDSNLAQEHPSRTAADIEAWLIRRVANRLGVPESAVEREKPFSHYGINSVEAVSIAGDLATWLDATVSPTLAWDYPCIKLLATHLAGEDQFVTDAPPTYTSPPIDDNAVAIIGIGCRFPGASNPDAFWQLLRNGGNAISLDRPERWNGNASTRSQRRWGGFLDEIDRFDAHFFGIAPREVVEMDPQQRLLLEVTWEALEHGGQAVDGLAGSRTAVFVGISTHDFAQILLNRDQPEKNDAYSVTGSSNSIAANRISYLFNFRGPSLAVDTACSSSLVAVHLACRSLRTGECDLALAGGVNLILTPALTEAFAKAHMMAADGRCKTFDAAADGYVRGEGCGVVVLKRLSDAYKDGDNIWAVVRGSAVNQDGRSNGLTAPNGPAQEAVIREALRDAGVSALEIGYVEAHGSGTPLGDPIEVGALKAVMLADRNGEQHCGIGSVKTNIGHLEAAAGIAGLIKTVLALRYEEIPPNLHLDRLNPHISLAGTPFYIPSKCHPWTQGSRRRFAGVSSFGFGGTNCHVILQEAPVIAPTPDEPLGAERRPHLFTLSAQSETALRQLTKRYESYLTEHQNLELGDVCHTANVGRSSFPYRLGVIAESISDLRERLTTFISGESAAGVLHSQLLDHDQCRIAFLFTGQGSQYVGMGKSLYETQPVFRKELDRCDEILRPYLERPLLSVLYSDASVSSLLDQTAYTQPALFALEYALVQMWKSWGIEPCAVLGHSVGEYVAACVAGVFSLEDGLKLIATRGQLMQSLPQNGEMAAVMASESRIASLIAKYVDQVSIASVNGFDSTVISGKRTAMREILAELDSLSIAWRPLSVSHAFHSPLMRPIIKPLEEAASRIQFSSPQIMLVSNLTGQSVQPELIRTPAYWSRHSLEPVRFLEGVQTLHKSGYEIFVEIGPHPTLLNMARRCVPGAEGAWLPSLRKGQDDWRQIIETLGTLYIQGAKINWRAFDEQSSRRKIVLPTYPFQRERYWLTPAEIKPVEAKRVETKPVETKWVETKPVVVKKPITPSQSKPLPLRSSSMQIKAPALRFGLMFFAASEDALVGDKYRLVVEAAKFADEHGFSSVWVPERHFTKFGCLYPNPAVLHAALARETKRIRLRAGSVVLPLHNPLRIAEEWAVVDNLSGGRVDLSFASGWHPNDFAFFPDKYGDRHGEMFSGIPQVQRLWRGETVKVTSGTGEEVEVRVYPTPVQRELPVWVTAAGNPETFRRAGEIGANVLTHLLDQGVEGLAGKIAVYREARARHGHDPDAGQVTVMLHTFIGDNAEVLNKHVRPPFCEYLKANVGLLKSLATSRERTIDIDSLSASDLDGLANFLYERFATTRALLGTAETCQPLVSELAAVGVDEVACLLDFGPETELILEHLPELVRLKEEVEQQSYEAAGTVESVTIGDEDERRAVVRSSRNGESEESDGRARVDDWIYRMQWEESAAVNGEKTKESLRGRWLIFADQGGVGEQVAARLREVGAECWVVKPGEKYQYSATGKAEIDGGDAEQVARLLEQVSGKESESSNGQSELRGLRGIIHLWSLDATPLEQTTSLKQFEEEVWRQTGSALHLVQGMAQSGVSARLWLVTRGVQAVGTARDEVAVEQAALWGLGRVCAMEHAELWGGLVDLDREAPVEQSAAELLEVLSAGDGEEQVVMRGGRRYVARLRRAEPGNTETKRGERNITLKREGAYLITGGLWGMGYEVARWLAERGAGQLVLMGRSALPEIEQWEDFIGSGTRVGQQLQKLRELEQLGVEVKYYAVDVGDEQQMQSWWKEYCESGGKRLRGVLHAASVWQDRSGEVLVRPLLRVNEKGLREVLHPKVSGGWVLERILGGEELDFYVCFSSGASLVGTAGLGNYAAASAFLDVLAEYRGRRGKAGLSINWGAIGEVGFGATAEGERVHAYWKDHGVERLRVTEVLAALEELITGEVSGQWGVMKVEWEQLAQRNPQVRDKKWAHYLVQSASQDDGKASIHSQEFLTRLLRVPRRQRREQLVQLVREQVMIVMGLTPSSPIELRRGLWDMGLDSLMALELKSRLEVGLGRSIPATVAFEFPTIEAIANYLDGEIFPLEHHVAPNGQHGNGNADPTASALEKIQQLSDEEVERLFNERMSKGN